MEDEIRNLWLYQAYDVFKQYDTGVKLDYIILLSILFVCIIVSGKCLKTATRKYWIISIPLIFLFSLVEGLRYLRGTDYLNYALLYKYYGDSASIEIVYIYMQKIFHAMGVAYWGIFVIYAFLWIITLLYFLRSYKEIIAFVLPIFIVFGLANFECFIRQNIALSIIFVFLHFLSKQKHRKALFCALIAFLIHSSSVVFIFYILLIWNFRFMVNPFIIALLYILAVFIIDAKIMGVVSKLILLSPTIDGTAMSSYIENADSWFGGDATKEKFARGMLTKIGAAVFDLTTVFITYEHIKVKSRENQRFIFFYNLFCVSLIFSQLFFTMEIPKRFFSAFYMFVSFLIAYIFRLKTSSKTVYFARCIIIIYIFVFFVKNILLFPSQLFVWDAHGIYNFHL
jgi:hypothetical protein